MMSKYFSSNLIPSTLLLFGILLSQSVLSNPIQYTFSQAGNSEIPAFSTQTNLTLQTSLTVISYGLNSALLGDSAT